LGRAVASSVLISPILSGMISCGAGKVTDEAALEFARLCRRLVPFLLGIQRQRLME